MIPPRLPPSQRRFRIRRPGFRYTWSYYRRGRTWYGIVNDSIGLEFQPYLTARSEKRIRRKIARFIRKQRETDFSRLTSYRSSKRGSELS